MNPRKIARLGQFQQILKTQVILIPNFTRPHAITYTNTLRTNLPVGIFKVSFMQLLLKTRLQFKFKLLLLQMHSFNAFSFKVIDYVRYHKPTNLFHFVSLSARTITRKFPCLSDKGQGPVSRKSRELFGPEKPVVKLRPAYSVKLVFSYVVKGIKIKITAKFRASRRLRFEDTKRIMSPEIRPKSFGTFEKQAPG